MCLLLETIRVEAGRFCYPTYHQSRIDRSMAVLFPGSPEVRMSEIRIPDDLGKGLYKCRFIYDRMLRSVEFIPYTPQAIHSFVLADAGDLDYSFKYLDRSGIEKLQDEYRSFGEIILVKNGFITDTSFSNLAFYSDSVWYTPEKPLLNGTCRQRLIQTGLIIPRPIRPDEINQFSHFTLLNAMLDFPGDILPVERIHPGRN